MSESRQFELVWVPCAICGTKEEVPIWSRNTFRGADVPATAYLMGHYSDAGDVISWSPRCAKHREELMLEWGLDKLVNG